MPCSSSHSPHWRIEISTFGHNDRKVLCVQPRIRIIYLSYMEKSYIPLLKLCICFKTSFLLFVSHPSYTKFEKGTSLGCRFCENSGMFEFLNCLVSQLRTYMQWRKFKVSFSSYLQNYWWKGYNKKYVITSQIIGDIRDLFYLMSYFFVTKMAESYLWVEDARIATCLEFTSNQEDVSAQLKKMPWLFWICLESVFNVLNTRRKCI